MTQSEPCIELVPPPLSIVVADDHPVVLSGVAAILAGQPDMRVAALCRTGEATISAVHEIIPDILVLDISMPGLSGIDVVSKIDQQKTKVVYLTAAATETQILDSIAQGILGIVFKDRTLDDLIACIRQVATGRPWFSDEVAELANARRLKVVSHPAVLTTRESEVMTLVAEGLSNKEVGKRLSLSEGTIKIHLHHIYEKVGVSNRTALAALAFGRANDPEIRRLPGPSRLVPRRRSFFADRGSPRHSASGPRPFFSPRRG